MIFCAGSSSLADGLTTRSTLNLLSKLEAVARAETRPNYYVRCS